MHEVLEQLKKIKAKRIFIQVPEGLVTKVQDIAKKLEAEGFEPFVCLEKTFGACDVREEEAKKLGCDCILHVGHSDFGLKTKIPVVYWEYFIDIDPCTTLEKEIEKLKNYKKIGLVANVQFINSLPKVKKYLESIGKKVFVYKSLKYPGQILGCRQDAALTLENKVDCFLCITAGKFYALGLSMKTDKPVLNLDLEKCLIESINLQKKKIEKLGAWAKVALKEAKRVGIFVSWKLGQLQDCSKIKNKLVKQGKEVYILAADELRPEKLEGLKLDVLINCACPRIGLDDSSMYKVPIVNVKDI